MSSTLPLSKGAAELELVFAYNANNTGFSCAAGSVMDGNPVTCTGTQKAQSFSVTVTHRAVKEKITLKGSSSASLVKATYSGPKGKLISSNVTVNLQARSAPINSTISLYPNIDAKGKLTGTGKIASGYGVSHTTTPLTGKMSLKKKAVSWTMKYASDKLSFAGKELQGAWSGKLTGTIGPVKVSQTISIPLSSLTLSRFHGTVTGTDTAGNQPLADVLVVVRSDLDNNETVDDRETKTVATDADGKFDVQFTTQTGRAVTVDFNLAGYSQTPKMFASITPGTDVSLSTALRKLDDLTISAGNATTADNKLQLDNLPPAISEMSGKVFNPVTEAAQFPGEFADNAGNMLVSSVFSNIQAQDAQGKKISELTNDTELRMLVPPDTWTTMRDLIPGNGQIDVPLYYYDETSGQWKRSTRDGWLENDARSKIAEAGLTAIQNGSYSGSVYAVGNITHLSYWNIDWPIDTHQCVCGRIVDADGNPVAGAMVSAKGVTYSGASAPVATGNDGRFCIDVMRSEAPSEDLDGDGVTSEQQKIVVTVSYNGKYYKLPESTLPITPATTGSAGCLQLGDVRLRSELELTSTLCTITGQAVYSGVWDGADPGIATGAPLDGVTVIGYDASTEDWWMQCMQTQCNIYMITGADGRFTLNFPILLGADLVGWTFSQPNSNVYQWYTGNMSINGCPTAPVTLKLDAWYYDTSQ